MPRPRATFPSGNPLPKNIKHASRKEDKFKKYRYIKADGSIKTLQSDDEKVITETAEYWNTKMDENCESGDEPKKFDKNSIAYHLDIFIQEHEEMFPSKVKSAKWKQNQQSIRKYLRPSLAEPTIILDKKLFKKMWLQMTPAVQRSCRGSLRSFYEYLDDNYLLSDDPRKKYINPFVDVTAGGFAYMEMPEKKTQILTLTMFNSMCSVAETKGFYFLKDAMLISMATYLREGDILSLRFDEDIRDGWLLKETSKSKARKKTKSDIFEAELSHHPLLNEAIQRSMLRRTLNDNAPYIIHHKYQSKNKSEHKDHHSQVMRRFFNSCWNKCADEIKEMKSVLQEERPGFHEIRALRKSLDDGLRPSKDISVDMGHVDEKVTDAFYGTHAKPTVKTLEYAFNPTLLGK